MNFLTVEDVLGIHAKQIAKTGGSPGVRDSGLLDAAVAAPRQTFSGQYLHEDEAAMAAAYLFHLAKNHAFEDGNKRTGFMAAETFLAINGYSLPLSDDEGYDLTMGVVIGTITKPELVHIIRSVIVPLAD